MSKKSSKPQKVKELQAEDEVSDTAWRLALKDGWDGESSKAVSFETRQTSIKIAELFPLGLQIRPEISADANGCITFDWTKDQEILSIVVRDSRIIFSAICKDEERRKGSTKFRGRLPSEVIEMIRKFGF